MCFLFSRTPGDLLPEFVLLGDKLCHENIAIN